MSDTTSLYRHFAADGSLLYVGISISWPARTQAHARMDAIAQARGWLGPLKHWVDSDILSIGDEADGMVQVLLHCATHSENEWHWISQHEYETIEANGADPGWVYSRR